MNYSEIRRYDIANGEGVRTVLFVSGCTHHCKGCFNSETWDFNFGKPFTEQEADEIIEYMKPPHVQGFTALGGEPFEHCNQQGLLPLFRRIKKEYPDKTIWCFSGYDFEKDMLGRMVKEWPETEEMLSYIDVLVDGEFVEEKKNIKLRFKGSENQRIILVQESLAQGKVVLWDPEGSDYYSKIGMDVKKND